MGKSAPARAALDAFFRIDDVGHPDLAGDGLHRALPHTLAAALAQLRIDVELLLPAVAVRAVLLHHMGQIFVPKIFQGASLYIFPIIASIKS